MTFTYSIQIISYILSFVRQNCNFGTSKFKFKCFLSYKTKSMHLSCRCHRQDLTGDMLCAGHEICHGLGHLWGVLLHGPGCGSQWPVQLCLYPQSLLHEAETEGSVSEWQGGCHQLWPLCHQGRYVWSRAVQGCGPEKKLKKAMLSSL